MPAALLGLGALAVAYESERDNLLDQVGIAATLSASSIDGFLQSHLAAVGMLARSVPDEADWGKPLADLHALYPAVLTLLRTDARGNIVASHPVLDTRANVADREYFREPARTLRPHVSDAFLGRGFGHDPLVAVSAPIVRDGRFAGVVEASIHVGAFTRLRSSAMNARGYEMLILDRDDHVVHASAGLPFVFAQDLRDAPFASRLAAAPTAHVDGVLRDGGGAFAARAPMQSGWTLVLFARDDVLTVPVRDRLGVIFAMLALAAAGTAIAVRLEMRRFAGTLTRVLAPLEALARDRRTERRPAGAVPSELLPLARAIDGLAARLDDARQDNAELDRLNRTDPLTGILNRRGIDDHLAQLQSGSTFAVAVFDVDLFKAFNDRYGHLAGDAALRRVAAAIASALRGPGDALGRIGGEEFLALLPDASLDVAQGIAERARRAVEALGIPHADAPGGRITVSGGVAVVGAGDALDPIESADAALYRAKHAGRNRVAT